MHGCRPPKRCPPPNPVQGISTCWDQSEALYNLVQEVLLDILKTDPEVLPQPPGVIDGSVAKPGYPGEVWTSSGTGSFSGANLAPPQVNFVILPAALPAGDWDFSYRMLINYVSNASPQAAVLWWPAPLLPGMTNDLMSYAPNIPQAITPYPGAGGSQPMVLQGSSPININSARGLAFNLAVWGGVSAPTGTYTFMGWARRRR